MLQNTSKTLGSKKSMVYKNTPGGRGKPYLAGSWFFMRFKIKKITFDPFFAPKCSKISNLTVLFDCLYKKDIMMKILNE